MLARLGVGVGEAGFAPAAQALIGDLYGSHRRSRALGIFMLGLPVGLLLAYFSVGAIAEAAGDWRAPFLVAAVPGVLLALWIARTKDTVRGAAEVTGPQAAASTPPSRPIRTLLSSRTMRWLIAAGVAFNFASYAVNTFTVPLLQRYYGLSLTSAAGAAGLVIGVTGLVGLLAGGMLGDRLSARSPRARLMLGAVASLLAAPLTFLGLRAGSSGGFVALFALGWLLSYAFLVTVYPALHDVVLPSLRASATAVYFAALYLTGGFAGPLVVGAISDYVSNNQAQQLGGTVADHAAEGLNAALFAVPLALAVTAACIAVAARHVNKESALMQQALAGSSTDSPPRLA